MQLTQEELRKAQLLMLKILKEIHRVCEENKINYFLCYGTLLGAVRHHGFIPWDDDCDIGMLREDYEKFLIIAKEQLSSEFILQTEDLDEGYGFEFSKIMLKNTLWVEKNVVNNIKRKYKGIFVDIFPFDKIPSNKFILCIFSMLDKVSQLFILTKLNYTLELKTFNKRIFFLISRFISIFFPIKLLRKIRKYTRKKFNAIKSNKYLNFDEYPKSIVNLDDIFELKSLPFENCFFYVPKKYDEILSNVYGNYMQLPSEDNRVSHSIIKFNLENNINEQD